MPPRPPLTYRLLRGGVRLTLRLFFREMAVEGRAHLPADRGGLLVAWHPNGLIDPALILAHAPVPVVFGARDGLFRWVLVGRVIRGLGTVPIYRAVDRPGQSEEERRAANARSLGALAGALAGGAFTALFPEGASHDRPYLTEVRSGAARLYLHAARLAAAAGRPAPALLPVGLHYDRKQVFRSDVLVAFHPALALPPDLAAPPPDADEAAEHERVDRLTAAIERALVHAVHATEDWALHAVMHRARTLLRAEGAARRGRAARRESVARRHGGFAQVWHGYQIRRTTHPDEIAALRRDLGRYDRLLRTLGLDDAHLDRPTHPAAPYLRTLALAAAGVLLAPLLALGYAVNAPPYWALKPLARKLSSAQKDAATVKLLGGLVLFPLAWATAAGLAAAAAGWLHEALPAVPDAPGLVAGAVFVLSAVGAAVALRYTEWAQTTWRDVRVGLTRQRRADRIAGLRAARADLHDRFVALAEGLPAPGSGAA
jgi:glycerol-3-phosphate O-acyltransferase/dihydroxyacetone phosphate acyltransferase